MVVIVKKSRIVWSPLDNMFGGAETNSFTAQNKVPTCKEVSEGRVSLLMH